MPRAAAFFDLDKTLMAGSSGMPFARVAMRHGIVSRRQLASWGVEHLRYRLRGTTDERTNDVLRQAQELLTGVIARDVERMNPEVMAAVLPRIYPQMLDEVHAHQDAGRATFIVSAAGNGVVEPLARVLGMDGGIGTSYEIDADGSFTGRFDGPFVYGPGKVEAMEAFAAGHDIDLAQSYAYSDSLSDLPMLEAVGHAGRRQSRSGAGRDRQARGLADDALRAPRPPARDRRDGAARGRGWMGRLTLRRAARLDFPHGRGPQAATGAARSARPSSRRCPATRSSRSTRRRTSRRTPRSGSAAPASTPSPAGPIPRCTAGGSGRCASSPASARSRRPTSASTTCSTTARPGSRPPSTCRR